MKKIILAVAAVTMIGCSTAPKPTEKLLIAGSYWDSIAIIDKATQNVEWAMALPTESGRPECNTISLTKNGDILFSYKKGARLIDRNGLMIWDYKTKNDSAEMQTAVQLANGNFMVATCDNPLLIEELDMNGIPVKEVKYEINIPNPHAQFRVVSKAKNGNYLIPVITQSKVIEINDAGELVKEYACGEGTVPFSLIELDNGNLLVSCGDSHSLVEIDRATGEATTKLAQNDVDGAKFQFVAGAAMLPNGNIIATNWLGHVAPDCADLQIVEFDAAKNLVWSYRNRPFSVNVSAVYPFAE